MQPSTHSHLPPSLSMAQPTQPEEHNIEGIGPTPLWIWSPDGKIIENITEYIASFCLGLIRVRQEAMESNALIWQCKRHFFTLSDEDWLTSRLAKVTIVGIWWPNQCKHWLSRWGSASSAKWRAHILSSFCERGWNRRCWSIQCSNWQTRRGRLCGSRTCWRMHHEIVSRHLGVWWVAISS
jgi:hypothetical protein